MYIGVRTTDAIQNMEKYVAQYKAGEAVPTELN